MGWLPKSRKTRRRLAITLIAAAVLVVAAGLAVLGINDAGSFFYTPSAAKEDQVPAGRMIRLGGLVEKGSVVRHPDGSIEFTITDNVLTARVRYDRDPPDLFREGQGAVCRGAFDAQGGFVAKEVLARHDEAYMPRELTKALKEAGEWRGDGAAPPNYGTSAP